MKWHGANASETKADHTRMAHKKRKYRLLLIRPRQVYKHYSTQYEMAGLMGKKAPSSLLALPLLAAYTPDYYQIRILDEEIVKTAEGYKADVVGINMITSNSERGYALAQHYRKAGAKVVMGGPYASYAVEEALQFADSVVIGEAENIWEEILTDFENNSLQKTYQSCLKAPFDKAPMPRWDLVPTRRILSINVQASRGCPFTCEFCLTSQYFGRKIRKRAIADIVNEIKQLPLKNILFVDDNLTLNKKYALELFDAIKPLKISWMCLSSVDVADDLDFLNKMAEAGCKYILIGFESLNSQSLAETHKHQNKREEYLGIIDRIHSVGIFVYASFIIGFDHDTPADFEAFKSFVHEAGLPVFMLNLLGATRGTELYNRLEKEGRLFNKLSKNFNVGMYPVFKHPLFEPGELLNLYYETLLDLYAYKNIRQRSLRLFETGYFNKAKNGGSITAWMKIRTSFTLVNAFLFSSNPEKRKLFMDLIGLIRAKKLDPGEAVAMLLMTEGIVRDLRKTKKHIETYHREVQNAG